MEQSPLSSPPPARLENLEHRRLLAAQVIDADAQLVIQGTDGDDYIEVEYDASSHSLIVWLSDSQSVTYSAEGITGISVYGGEGNDYIYLAYCGPSDVLLDGGGGDDKLYAGDGGDTLIGGEGNDILVGGNSDDSLDGGAGHDMINGNNGADTLLGSDGDDTLYGGWDDDVLRGGAGVDSVDGNFGADTIVGLMADDVLLASDETDVFEDEPVKPEDPVEPEDPVVPEDPVEPEDPVTEPEDPVTEQDEPQKPGKGKGRFSGRPHFAGFERHADWLRNLLADARDGGVRRFQDEVVRGIAKFARGHGPRC